MKLLSPLASIARGSVAGDTFTANQFAQIIVRQRTAPVQPGTVNQTKIKSAFTTASVQWKALTGPQRQAWIDYAATLTFSGPLGTYKVPGRQVFLSNYGWATYLADRNVPGQTVDDTAPTTPGFASIQNLNIETPSDSDIGYKVVGNNNNPENISVIVMNSVAFHSSRNRFKGPFKSDTIFSASVVEAGAFTINVVGLVEGNRYFCSVRAITLEEGHRLSALFFLNEIANSAA